MVPCFYWLWFEIIWYLFKLLESSNFIHFCFKIHPIKDAPTFIWLSVHLLACSFQLVVPCYFGSFLADKTDQLSFKLYDSNWPDMSPKFKSTMSIVLEVTKAPISMCTSWNLFVITLPTFVRVSAIENWIIFQKEKHFFLYLFAGNSLCIFNDGFLKRNGIKCTWI